MWPAGADHGAPLQAANNLFVLGARDYRLLPSYLQHAHAAIAPFDVRRHSHLMQSVEAIKLYEYLTVGLPVVSTRWPQSEGLAPRVTCVEQSPRAFAAALRDCLDVGAAKPIPDTVDRTWDWSNRLQPLLAALG